MKNILVIIALVVSLTITQVKAQTSENASSREVVSRDLITLRDSVNMTLTNLQKNSTIAIDQQHDKEIQDLVRQKVQLDKSIDEIVNSKQWNKDLSARTTHTMDDVRKEYKRIKDALGKEN